MKGIRIFAVTAAVAALAACGGGADNTVNNADANVSLESENLDAGLNAEVNATDLNAANAVDANAAGANAANATDANAATNNAQ